MASWDQYVRVFVRGSWPMVFCCRCHDILCSTRRSIENHLVRCSKLDRLAARDAAEAACKEHGMPETTETTFSQWLSRQIESLDGEIEAPDIGLDMDVGWGCGRCAFGALDKAKHSGKSAVHNHSTSAHPGQEAIAVDGQLLLVVMSGTLRRYIRATRTDRPETVNWAEVLLRRRAENDAAATAVESRHEKQPNVMLDKLKFDKHVAGYEARDLIRLYEETKGEPEVSDAAERAGRALKDIANEAQTRLSSGTSQIRTMLNMRERGVEAGEINTLDPASIGKYVATWKKITTYAIRLWQIQMGDAPAGPGWQAPCTLTTEQAEAVVSLARARNAEETRASVMTLVLALLTQPLKESDWANPILSVYAIFALAKDGS